MLQTKKKTIPANVRTIDIWFSYPSLDSIMLHGETAAKRAAKKEARLFFVIAKVNKKIRGTNRTPERALQKRIVISVKPNIAAGMTLRYASAGYLKSPIEEKYRGNLLPYSSVPKCNMDHP